jgi:tRNA threonylcarbamoyladenosine dehydratase
MTEKWLERTALLIKEEGLQKLKNAHVIVVGLGGVGSFAAEFIARAGVGHMTIVDGDVVDITNINRQLPALHSTVDRPKIEVVAERLMDINPQLQLTQIHEFLNPDRMLEVLSAQPYHYILDCIDSVTPKVELLKAAKRLRIKAVSAMGAGGKSDPAKVIVKDLSKTKACYLAKQVRKRLKAVNITTGIRCVFSTEVQQPGSLAMTDGTNFKKSYYGTISFMPALFGLHVAAEVINKLTQADV